MKNRILSTILLGAAVPLTGEAVEFIPLGDLPGGETFSISVDLSADGSTVLAQSSDAGGTAFFRWNFDTGLSLVSKFDPGAGLMPHFFATSISGDGSLIAGYAFTGAFTEGLKWSATDGFQALGVLPSASGGSPSSLPVDISADGNSVAASGTAPLTSYTSALLWNSVNGLAPLGFLPDHQPDGLSISFSFAQAVSGDGQVVVGSSARTDRGEQAFRWTVGAGMQALGFLTGETISSATAVSADGNVVAGISGLNAFRWTPEAGMEPIGEFIPTRVSADGNVVVGTSFFDQVAVIWTPSSGAQPLQTYLEEEFNFSAPGWTFTGVTGISDDASVLAGNGFNANGISEAFLVKLNSAVLTTGAVSFTGAVDLFILDPSARGYGLDPETGEFRSEIPDLNLSEDAGVKTAAWADISSGRHLVYLTGSAPGAYEVDFDFLHSDNQSSGATFSGDLLANGVHIYAAEFSAETASTAQYRLIYADTDGDGLGDGSDAIPRSDLRSTIIIGDVDTGLPNRILADGSTLNDIINAEAAKAENHGEFVSAIAGLTKLWASGGIMPKEARSLVQSAAAQSDIP